MVGWPGMFSNGEGANGTLNQTGGNFETRAVAYIGLLTGGTGSLNVSGGTNTTARMIVGWNAGGNGTINLSGGNKVVRETSFVGFDGGTGTLNISGGTYTATGTAGLFLPGENFGSFRIADFGNNSGTVNLSGTGVVNAANYTAVGGWGNGTLNITGGTWNQLSEEILVGDAADPNWTGRGEVNQSGGTVNATEIVLQKGTYNLNGTGVVNASSYTFVGDRGNGTLNISGGVFNAGTNQLGSFRIADSGEATAVGTMSLSGSGVVNAPSYTSVGGLGTGTLNISGGTWNSPDDIVLGDRPPNVTDWTGTGVVNQTGGAVNARAVFL
ncbi:MAG: hypothetical protein EBT77_08290, partial [Verrucomicrobia bacterium]|nr:hypothetical protein [Verrucomicrobiota bacterium]